MDNKEISPDTVLKNHGGANGKNFAEIINEGQDEDEVNIIRHSPYYVPSNLPSDLANKDNSFSVLSLNAQSLFYGLQNYMGFKQYLIYILHNAFVSQLYASKKLG